MQIGDKMRIMMLASGDLWAGAEVMVYQLVCEIAISKKETYCCPIEQRKTCGRSY